VQEQKLCDLAKEGDQESASQLWLLLKPITTHIAKQYSRSSSDIDDFVSEASITMIKCIESHDAERKGGASFRTYYIHAIHKRFSRFYKKNQVLYGCEVDKPAAEPREEVEDLFDYSHDDGTEQAKLATESAAFFQNVPEEQRKIITDVLGGMSLHAFAKENGISYESARMRLRRAVDSVMVNIKIYSPELVKLIPPELRDILGGGEKTLFKHTIKTAQSQCTDQH